MPIINGKKVKSRFTSLMLKEISSVDNPAQPDALGAVIKRMDPLPETIDCICKYVGIDDGAHTFREVLSENKFSEQIWPFTDALSQSIKSIVGDDGIEANKREEKIRASVEEFLDAVSEISPSVHKSLSRLLTKEESKMSKTVEQLEQDLAKANAKIEDLKKQHADALAEKADEVKAAKEDLTAAQKALDAATEEVVKVEGQEVKKSEVGAAQFAMVKSLVQKDERRELEKRATEMLPSVSGSAAAKAALLKAAESIEDEDVRKEATEILTSAEKMVSLGFDRNGSNDLDGTAETKKVADAFNEKVNEVAKRDNISISKAMGIARREFPQEFEAYQQTAN